MMNDSQTFVQRKMKDQICRIIFVEHLASQIHRIRFEFPFLAQQAQPGQFVNIRVSDGMIPLLRRPFSVHRVHPKEGWVEILFDIRGTGTQLLAGKAVGESITVLGPLGNPFNTHHQPFQAIFLAGGIGIAPFLFLAEKLNQYHIAMDCYYGAKTHKDLCCLEEFKILNVRLKLATDDGSSGFNGFVTELFKDDITRQKINNSNPVIFACGPVAMLRAVQKLALERQIKTQLSLEAIMGCGFGVCVGCAVPVAAENNNSAKYKLVCQDGPIFSAEEVILPD